MNRSEYAGGGCIVSCKIPSWCIWLSIAFPLQLPQTNPGFNNTPFKFTKYSNAYMLVYVRDADKDKVVCNVDEKDIAEHLQVRCITDIIGHIILLQEQTELSASYEFIDSMWGDMIRLENFSIYESFIYRKYPA